MRFRLGHVRWTRYVASGIDLQPDSITVQASTETRRKRVSDDTAHRSLDPRFECVLLCTG